MSWLTRDGTAKPVSRNQIISGGKEIFPCSADHEQDWQPYAVDLYSAVRDDHTCIRIYLSVYSQLPPVIGAPWGCCGHSSGIYFPRRLWFGGCATHATPCSVPGYLLRTTGEARVDTGLRRYYLVVLLLPNIFTLACLLLSSI